MACVVTFCESQDKCRSFAVHFFATKYSTGLDVSQQRVVVCAVSILDAAGKLEHTTLFEHLHYPEVVTLYLPALQGRQPYFDMSVTI